MGNTAEHAEEDRDHEDRLNRMRAEKVQAGRSETEGKTTQADLPRPSVTEGAVAANLFNELRALFHRCQVADAFEAKVNAAAKSPAAWLLLREELSGPTDVVP